MPVEIHEIELHINVGIPPSPSQEEQRLAALKEMDQNLVKEVLEREQDERRALSKEAMER